MPEEIHPVRLNILSDLHLSRAGLPLPTAEADIVILAGDISRPKEAIEWASGFKQPVLYVPGNHEFYGCGIKETIARLKHYAQGTHIRILDNDEVVLHGIRFIGSTLWTDFNLDGPGIPRERAIAEALEFNYDFSRIKSDLTPGATLSPTELEAIFNRNRAWLQRCLDQPFKGMTVVITHHAPSPKSIHPRFESSAINTCFVSNSEDLISSDRAILWIHGHTHDSFDYEVNGTRIVCNPRGYVLDGVVENKKFDPDLVIELRSA
ncbi:MAG: metallophosphoesterase [Pusillimonas sp.]